MSAALNAGVEAVALSRDGVLLAAGHADGRVDVVRLQATGGRCLSGLSGVVSALAFSPDGRLLAAGDRLGALVVWSIADGDVRFRHRLPAEVLRVVVDDEGAVAWDARGTLQRSGVGPDTTSQLLDPVRALAVVYDGTLRAIEGVSLTTRALPSLERQGSVGILTASAMAAVDGVLVFSPSGTALLIHWDELETWALPDARICGPLPFVPDVRCAAVSDDGTVWALGTADGALVTASRRRKLCSSPIRALVMDASGMRLAVLAGGAVEMVALPSLEPLG